MITKTQPGYVSEENTVNDIVELFLQAYPRMNEQEQHLALSLYRLLARGAAVSSEQLAMACDQPVNVIENRLASWPGVIFDDDKCVIGFFGLTIRNTSHQLVVNGQTVFAWCAFDTLFIPQLLNDTVQVTSTCPVTNEEIRLTVSPDGIEAADSKEIVVSFLIPDINEVTDNVTASFCHYVYFFNNFSIGEQWCKEHPDTFLLSLEDAFEVGKRLNAERYNRALK